VKKILKFRRLYQEQEEWLEFNTPEFDIQEPIANLTALQSGMLGDASIVEVDSHFEETPQSSQRQKKRRNSRLIDVNEQPLSVRENIQIHRAENKLISNHINNSKKLKQPVESSRESIEI